MRWVFTGGGPWDGREMPAFGWVSEDIPAAPADHTVELLDGTRYVYKLDSLTEDRATYWLASPERSGR
jgi:hypothetical protein